ncbi:AAA family ATPase [Rathayibacter sp. SD072]|uniref:AAA family ATPase n=1 Tax=Rathayibacter sp. SD072 TaxID=2781731 RepID=UPI001A962210|nr:AAA family ATPase [Rathayibacter sp. SD072]MBO0985274.1 AAA family ATPase [Rathayibacter sp. SD072]
MWISRIRVTGGFLGGLDVTLSKGLNVIVGPRGAGKTTFLELLRHAVGAQHAEQSGATERARRAFLDAVLGSGEVIVDLEAEDGGRHLVVDAKGGGQRLDLSGSVLVLGQNELEEIASDAPSRLKLLDLRVGIDLESPDLQEIRSLTGEAFDLRKELSLRQEESEKRRRLLADRDLFLSQEASLLGGRGAQLTDQRQLLRIVEERVIATGQELIQIESVKRELAEILGDQRGQTERLRMLTERATSLGPDAPSRDGLDDAVVLSDRVEVAIRGVMAALLASETDAKRRNIEAREEAAPIREELDEAEAGLGQITAQLRNVDVELRALDENDEFARGLERRYADVLVRRSRLFDGAELVEEALYASRAEVARSTTAHISNNVVVAVDHLADVTEYRKFLQDSLRGSNTRATLTDLTAERVLPRQLLEMVETGDAAGLSSVAGIAEDRAQRLIDNMSQREFLQGLAGTRLIDNVDFRLRDGSVDKSVDSLSTGQKCAVTLPIVLSERERTLILDQPEDHLDNAFLVANIISGLNRRTQDGAQTIVATHNANVPVLGSADNVVVLESDGKAGRVDVQGVFDTKAVVEKITKLMEGGKDAFARRAAFYAEYGEPQ